MVNRSALVAIVTTMTAGRLSAAPVGTCGTYAEDLGVLSPQAREIERHAQAYSFAVRTEASYECPWYAPDGSLRVNSLHVQAHGTAFGLRADGNDTLLVTNDHVAAWPAATDAEHPVDGVGVGCRRVATSLKIVDDDHDTYAADDIPLAVVATDPALDVAVLRAHQKLPVMPWKIGTSAGLVTRDVVEVRGFPLGELAATNVGKVTSTFDHDEQGEWNHDDFLVDALVSSGNSGSPVLAVSCKTGEFELVGIFHAHYNNASALNVVISIDQVRDLLATLKPSPTPARAIALDAAARDKLVHALASDSDPPFFTFGSLTASVRARPDGALVFAVFAADFPRTTRPLLVVEDVASVGGFGTLGASYVAQTGGLGAIGAASTDDRALLGRALDALRRDAIATFELREQPEPSSKDQYKAVEAKRKALGRMLDGQRDMQQAVADLAGRSHAASDKSISLSQLESVGHAQRTAAKR
jgi:S1-C subfamily serine protease